jgi:hypothetical protein
MLRRAMKVLVAALAVVAILFLLSKQPRLSPRSGTGELYRYLWCMGVAFDSGEAHPVHSWPDGMHVPAQGIDVPAVLVDEAGSVVFREGDRVSVTATLVRVDSGDTACANLNSLGVDTIELLATAPPASQSR